MKKLDFQNYLLVGLFDDVSSQRRRKLRYELLLVDLDINIVA